MDPDANLKEQLRLANLITPGDCSDPADVDRLAELVIALHGWISAGGFLPEQWNMASKKTGDLVKITLSIPKTLRERMSKFDNDINWSELARELFVQTVSSLEKSDI